jgi:FMN phosphatase YigB (HAD superfamily)
MSERLILFDVDGTLLTTNGQATAAMRTAYRRIYGVTVNFDGTPTDGKTELCLAYQLLGAVGLSREQVRRGLPAYWPVSPACANCCGASRGAAMRCSAC